MKRLEGLTSALLDMPHYLVPSPRCISKRFASLESLSTKSVYKEFPNRFCFRGQIFWPWLRNLNLQKGGASKELSANGCLHKNGGHACLLSTNLLFPGYSAKDSAVRRLVGLGIARGVGWYLLHN